MLNELRCDFLEKQINKLDYMKRLNKEHQKLYEYSSFIKDTNCIGISIRRSDVVYTFLSEGIKIKMVCIPFDNSSVPFTHIATGSYDLKETKFLLSVLSDDSVIFDVGANLGWYTLHFLKKFNRTIVHSFEPVKKIFSKLFKNKIINLCDEKRVYLNNFGLSDSLCTRDMFFDLERCGASSMERIQDHNSYEKVHCRFLTLDNYMEFRDIKKIDLIKIDVEGAEKLVINGSLKTIEKYKPMIYAELLRKWSAKFSYHPNDVIEILSGIGYNCYVIDNNLKLKQIIKITEKTEETNFFFKVGV